MPSGELQYQHDLLTKHHDYNTTQMQIAAEKLAPDFERWNLYLGVAGGGASKPMEKKDLKALRNAYYQSAPELVAVGLKKD